MVIYFSTARQHRDLPAKAIGWISFRRVSRTLKVATEEAFVKAILRRRYLSCLEVSGWPHEKKPHGE